VSGMGFEGFILSAGCRIVNWCVKYQTTVPVS
jgi:hypothetical protein